MSDRMTIAQKKFVLRSAAALVMDAWDADRWIDSKCADFGGQRPVDMPVDVVTDWISKRASEDGPHFVCRACIKPAAFISIDEGYWCGCGGNTIDKTLERFDALPSVLKPRYARGLRDDEEAEAMAKASVRHVHSS